MSHNENDYVEIKPNEDVKSLTPTDIQQIILWSKLKGKKTSNISIYNREALHGLDFYFIKKSENLRNLKKFGFKVTGKLSNIKRFEFLRHGLFKETKFVVFEALYSERNRYERICNRIERKKQQKIEKENSFTNLDVHRANKIDYKNEETSDIKFRNPITNIDCIPVPNKGLLLDLSECEHSNPDISYHDNTFHDRERDTEKVLSTDNDTAADENLERISPENPSRTTLNRKNGDNHSKSEYGALKTNPCRINNEGLKGTEASSDPENRLLDLNKGEITHYNARNLGSLAVNQSSDNHDPYLSNSFQKNSKIVEGVAIDPTQFHKATDSRSRVGLLCNQNPIKTYDNSGALHIVNNTEIRTSTTDSGNIMSNSRSKKTTDRMSHDFDPDYMNHKTDFDSKKIKMNDASDQREDDFLSFLSPDFQQKLKYYKFDPDDLKLRPDLSYIIPEYYDELISENYKTVYQQSDIIADSLISVDIPQTTPDTYPDNLEKGRTQASLLNNTSDSSTNHSLPNSSHNLTTERTRTSELTVSFDSESNCFHNAPTGSKQSSKLFEFSIPKLSHFQNNSSESEVSQKIEQNAATGPPANLIPAKPQYRQLKYTGPREYLDIIALDCEMVRCGVRPILARISICNRNGICIYDKFVKPKEPITDYVTRYSGITPECFSAANSHKIVTENDLYDQLSKIIHPETVIVGQSLYNDFEALQILHKKFIDTSFLFKDKTNRRHSLKVLAKKYLGKSIQKFSHCSFEDALACLELVAIKCEAIHDLRHSQRYLDFGANLLSFSSYNEFIESKDTKNGDIHAIECESTELLEHKFFYDYRYRLCIAFYQTKKGIFFAM